MTSYKMGVLYQLNTHRADDICLVVIWRDTLHLESEEDFLFDLRDTSNIAYLDKHVTLYSDIFL